MFHCQLATGTAITQADLDSWLNSFQAAFKTNLGAQQPAAVAYVAAQATFYSPGGGVLQSTVAMTGAGTSGTVLLEDAAACKVISWLSTVYWRGGKPRTYLAGVGGTEQLTGSPTTLTAVAIAALKTSAAAFRTAINALTVGTITGTVLGFVSFSTGNADRVPAVFFPFSGVTVHPRLGTQRRRLGKWQL